MTNTDNALQDALDLADAITLLRDQIAEAQRRLATSGDKGVRFTVGEITLVFGVELSRTRGLNGGLRFGLVNSDGKRESGRKATHEITLKLNSSGPAGPTPVDDVM